MMVDLERLSRADDSKLSASWEAPHVILNFLAFYFIAFNLLALVRFYILVFIWFSRGLARQYLSEN